MGQILWYITSLQCAPCSEAFLRELTSTVRCLVCCSISKVPTAQTGQLLDLSFAAFSFQLPTPDANVVSSINSVATVVLHVVQVANIDSRQLIHMHENTAWSSLLMNWQYQGKNWGHSDEKSSTLTNHKHVFKGCQFSVQFKSVHSKNHMVCVTTLHVHPGNLWLATYEKY